MEQRAFSEASLEYVFLLQEVQERKKFEFVETVSTLLFEFKLLYLVVKTKTSAYFNMVLYYNLILNKFF